jgi:hypothetical protein
VQGTRGGGGHRAPGPGGDGMAELVGQYGPFLENDRRAAPVPADELGGRQFGQVGSGGAPDRYVPHHRIPRLDFLTSAIVPMKSCRKVDAVKKSINRPLDAIT